MCFIGKRGFSTLALGLAMLTSLAHANGGGGGPAFVEGVNYIPIKPALVVNYGGAGKVKYIKAEISIRADSMLAAQEISHHMPLVRDTLIMLISSVTDEQMSSGEGKEQMRLQALTKLNEALELQIGGGHEEPAKEEKPKKDAHAKDSKAKKDSHAKDDHAKPSKKDAHAKADEHAEAEHGGPISDLLFDNLVVQK